MKKNLLIGLMGLGLLAYYARAQEGNWLEAIAIRLGRQGAATFRFYVNSSDQLELQVPGLTGASAVGAASARTAAIINDADGALLLRTRTNAQLGSLAADSSGYVLVNISVGELVISTGTGPGAWVFVSSYTNAGGARVVGYQ